MPDNITKTSWHRKRHEEKGGGETPNTWNITTIGLRNSTTSHQEIYWTLTKDTENWQHFRSLCSIGALMMSDGKLSIDVEVIYEQDFFGSTFNFEIT